MMIADRIGMPVPETVIKSRRLKVKVIKSCSP